MNPVKHKLCPTCGNPYGTLPPIDAVPQLVTPEGKEVVAGTLSEKTDKLPEPPKAPVDLFTLQPPEVEPKEVAARPELTPMLGGQLEGMRQAPMQPDPFDDPLIGGKITICTLMYGNYPDMHRSCLGNLIGTTPPDRVEIRVGCNEVCTPTLEYLSSMLEQGRIHRVLVNQTNVKKYPAMRQLFWDKEMPITTPWLIWFDDDSMANRDSAWLNKLLTKITHSEPAHRKLAMFGAQFSWQFSKAQIAWIRSRPWYRNRHFQTHRGRAEASANRVVFPAGGFFALSTDVMRAANIPDEQIGNNGGDYMIAEQAWQTGFGMSGWNNKKQFIHTSSVQRRGLSEVHTGMTDKGWVPGGVLKSD
jgi:hypothetical protein